MGGEDVVAVDGAVGRCGGYVGADVGEQAQGQRVGRVGVGDGALGDAVAGAGVAGLVGGEVAEDHTGREVFGARASVVQQGGRVAGLLPVLGGAGHHQAGARRAQPAHGLLGPPGEPPVQAGRHLLGVVEEEQQGASGRLGERGETLGLEVAGVLRRERQRGGHVGGGPGQGAAGGVGERGVVLAQVGPAQPQRGEAGVVAAGGEGGEFGTAAAAGRADKAQDGRVAALEGVQLGADGGPFDRFHDRPRGAPCRRGGGETDDTGEVEIGPVRGDRGRVLHEQRGEGGNRGAQGTAKPTSEAAVRSAVPRTPTTVPVTGSSTGPPAAPPPSRSASRPAVPTASSRAPGTWWVRSVAV